jgi:RimJ/RimL family protein N-acetyltransferase
MLLENDLLRLDSLHDDQLEDLARYVGEEGLWIWWLDTPPNTPERLAAEWRRARELEAQKIRKPFAIFHKETGSYIGSTSLWFDTDEAGDVEIGSSWLGLPFHGTGLNRSAKALLIRHAFEDLGIDRVILQTDRNNLRSQRAIRKLGAELIDERSGDKTTWDGRVRDSLYFAITRETARREGFLGE